MLTIPCGLCARTNPRKSPQLTMLGNGLCSATRFSRGLGGTADLESEGGDGNMKVFLHELYEYVAKECDGIQTPLLFHGGGTHTKGQLAPTDILLTTISRKEKAAAAGDSSGEGKSGEEEAKDSAGEDADRRLRRKGPARRFWRSNIPTGIRCEGEPRQRQMRTPATPLQNPIP